MKDLIVKKHPKSPVSEAYRAVRTNIQFANIDKDTKTILVTSATPGEGKSTTLSNVAITLADAGNKVLIMDCDFRKPKVHKTFEISNAVGITDLLLSGEDFQAHVHKAIHKNLHILTAGRVPSNPSEILDSKTMKQFIEHLKTFYDFILIDTPPVLPVTDAVILSTYVDKVILVCASGEVAIDYAKRAKESLDKVGADILGVVINKINIKSRNHYYYYYYHEKKKGKKND